MLEALSAQAVCREEQQHFTLAVPHPAPGKHIHGRLGNQSL